MHLDHHERAAVEAQVLHSVLGPAQDEPGWRRESCLGEVRAPVVDHRATYHQALRLMRSGRLRAFDLQREPGPVRASYGDSQFGKACLLARRLVEAEVPFVGVVARSEEVERGRWAKNVDEHRLGGDSFQAALAIFQSRRDVVLARRVELRRSSRSRPRPRTEHQRAARVRPLDRRTDRERKPLRHQFADARTGAREEISAGGSDEDVDGALATEPHSPDRLLVRTGIVVQQARRALADHVQRARADVGLQAPAADASGRAAVLGCQEFRAGPPVGRAGDAHHRGYGRAHACGSQTRRLVEDGCGLVPMLHEDPRNQGGFYRRAGTRSTRDARFAANLGSSLRRGRGGAAPLRR